MGKGIEEEERAMTRAAAEGEEARSNFKIPWISPAKKRKFMEVKTALAILVAFIILWASVSVPAHEEYFFNQVFKK